MTYLNVRGEVVPVDGEPLVREEPGLVPGLDVVDNDVGEVPGLHLPDAAVVVPDPHKLQRSQRPVQYSTVASMLRL